MVDSDSSRPLAAPTRGKNYATKNIKSEGEDETYTYYGVARRNIAVCR